MHRGAGHKEVDVIAYIAGSDARYARGVDLPVDSGTSTSSSQPNINP